MTLEKSDHHGFPITTQIDLRQLELDVREGPWWRIIVTNLGFRNRKKLTLPREMRRFNKPHFRKEVRKTKPMLKDLTNSERKEKKTSKYQRNKVLRTESGKKKPTHTFPDNHPKAYLFSTPPPSTSLTLPLTLPPPQNISGPSSSTIRTPSFILNAVKNLPPLPPLQILMEDLYLCDEERH
ncbi:UNVERIFIED_CONTAM: hypothetical protein RMT77_007112 [Armadillidium vulgare]